ncbi:hypothetical protein A2V82_15340 [candidate division KSB1 bacterium RBG_16_48_16]|nr:MAG: hypothetical protein A2V82_15340 [candidate division KSB1 bacterium RBG_16_48_16]
MMRALISGVSGLKNHQIQMDVIGNNIANVNTIGYKANRVTFQESISQALQVGLKPDESQGGTNPMYVGIGMNVGSIDKVFNQGTLERTDNRLDLAIQGDAFFVMNDGSQDFFTKAGNFQIDSEGYLVFGNTALRVQGRMADAIGNVTSSTEIGDIVFPFGQKAPPKATSKITLTGNLDSSSDKVSQVLTTSFAKQAYVSSGEWSDIDSSVLDTDGDLVISSSNNQIEVTIDDDAGSTFNKTISLTEGTYKSFSELVSEINTQLEKDRDLAGEVAAKVVDGKLRIGTVDNGGTDTFIELGGSFAAISLAATPGGTLLTTDRAYGVTAGDSTSTPAVASTDLADLPFLVGIGSLGDQIKITATDQDGSAISETFIYGPTDPADPDYSASNSGTTVAEFMEFLNDKFSSAFITLEANGALKVTDAVAGDSDTALNITIKDTETNTTYSFPSFSIAQTGKEAAVHSTSILVYDSKGKTHNIEFRFTNISSTENPDLWRWEAVIDNDELVASAGGKGFVKFNPNGSLATFEITDGQPLTFGPGEGSATMQIKLDPGTADQLNGLTQFGRPTTTVAEYQDGYGGSYLYDFSIDETGTITGLFTDGVNQVIGQISVAKFNNPTGLDQAGENLFSVGANSGRPSKGWAGSTISAEVTSGHLEMSTVDLAQEFTNMIIAQRGFQANARVISTADTLLDEITRLKR